MGPASGSAGSEADQGRDPRIARPLLLLSSWGDAQKKKRVLILLMISVGGKKAFPLHLHHAPNRFFYNAFMHFRNAHLPVDKSYGKFLDFEAESPGGKFHLNLKGIAYKFNFI
jgi:hypothetical protein